ncbi:MAG: c-type cytochrome [Hyphomicrobiaceae bacterium]
MPTPQSLLLRLTSSFLVVGLAAPIQAGDTALGEYLSGQCTTCHQLSGKVSGIPSIVGWDQESFIAVMQSYQNKERDNKVMQNIAGTLTAEDIAALAAYFATIKPNVD